MDEASVLIWAWDNTNQKWIPVVINAQGQLVIVAA